MANQKIDKLDKQILTMIAEDARVPFLEVARACNVSGAAISLICSYEVPCATKLRLIHELSMPVPLMHSSTPVRGFSAVWLTWAKVFTRLLGS